MKTATITLALTLAVVSLFTFGGVWGLVGLIFVALGIASERDLWVAWLGLAILGVGAWISICTTGLILAPISLAFLFLVGWEAEQRRIRPTHGEGAPDAPPPAARPRSL